MSKFISKIIGGIILIIGLLFLGENILVAHRGDICKTDAHILFLGTSRIQYSVNDRLLANTLNAGLNADNYIFSYFKLQLLHKYNPQIDTLFLIYDASTIFHSFNVSDEKFHPFYWDLLDSDDFKNILLYDRDCFSTPLQWLKIKVPLESYFKDVKFQDLGIGQYSDLFRDKLPEDIERWKKSAKQNCELHIDTMQSIYLHKIVSFCREKNVKLFLINPPTYKLAYDVNTDRLLDSYVKKKYPDIPYLDFEFISVPDSCFGDMSHLNYRGADYFTNFLIDTLKLQRRI